MHASLADARMLVSAAREVVDAGVMRLAADAVVDGRVDVTRIDAEQVLAYDLASAAAAVTAAEGLLALGETGELAELLAVGFAGRVAAEVGARVQGREALWGIASPPWQHGQVATALAAARSPALLDAIAERALAAPDLPRVLDEDLELVRRTFRDFARERVEPVAERIHREDADVPEDLITALAEMGCFGLSIPATYGGSAAADGPGPRDLLSVAVVTEELSRASLGAAGSLITRPEILARALLAGGTEEQRRRWLPLIASGERMCAVAVTEPDHGSDVANLETTATADGESFVLQGVKTWCTFAGRAELLLVLARTGSRDDGHRGLSLFVVEKPARPGLAWTLDGEHGGRLTARAIDTLGYRGMHSFELAFDGYRVPAANLVGGDAGAGRGFPLQMAAFANGRLQTAARALGLMAAAFDAAAGHAGVRHVFGAPLARYQLTRAKLAGMAYRIAACRRFAYRTAALLGGGGETDGQLEASMVKSLACRDAEWVTREAQQIHGGYGYAEEYAVSRYFVDARVLPIFEGADEVLALRVIIRRLLAGAPGDAGTPT